MGSRRFTEKEAAAIMRKAAENQPRTGQSSSGEGFSEEELHAAARELGIDAAAVDAAIEAVDQPEESGKPGFFGGPYTMDFEVVANGTMTDEKWEEILADIRKTFGEAGTINRRGSTYEWIGTGGGVYPNTVTVRESGGSARVRVDSNMSGLGFLGYLIALLPMFITIGVLAKLKLDSPFGLVIGSIMALVYFLVARAWAIGFSKKCSKDLQSFLSRTRKHIESGTDVRARLETETAAASEEASQVIDQA